MYVYMKNVWVLIKYAGNAVIIDFLIFDIPRTIYWDNTLEMCIRVALDILFNIPSGFYSIAKLHFNEILICVADYWLHL